MIALDTKSGDIAWEKTAAKGVPKVKRHMKSSHANSTVATDGNYIVACFGSEGLFCYTATGDLKWKLELGTLSSGWFFDNAYEWGFGSSPTIWKDTVILQCDVGKGSFVAAYSLSDGKEVWKTPRDEVPSWGSPTVIDTSAGPRLVLNGTKFVRAYDPTNGKEIWRIGKNSEITVPTPFRHADLTFVCSGYSPIQPIYAIRDSASGDLSLEKDKTSNAHVAWSKKSGGPYMPSPIGYGGKLYVCSNAGMLTVYDAKSGEKGYSERLGGRDGFTGSSVAADGRLYFVGEDGTVRVVKAGPEFEMLAENPLGEAVLTTPAISDGTIYIRGQYHFFAFRRGIAPEKGEK